VSLVQAGSPDLDMTWFYVGHYLCDGIASLLCSLEHNSRQSWSCCSAPSPWEAVKVTHIAVLLLKHETEGLLPWPGGKYENPVLLYVSD
jgi:hypothetical protein